MVNPGMAHGLASRNEIAGIVDGNLVLQIDGAERALGVSRYSAMLRGFALLESSKVERLWLVTLLALDRRPRMHRPIFCL